MSFKDLDRTKQYSVIKYSLALLDIVYLLILLFLFLGLGISKVLASGITKIAVSDYLVIPAYLFVIFIAYSVLDFPLRIYRSFTLEHKFSLSTQEFRNWLFDRIKAGIISFFLGLILLEAFYSILGHNPRTWWLKICLFWIFFSLILAKLFPIIIIPLFFKYKKLADDALRQRILNLAGKMKVRILDVFEINFSKKTLKANAAFVGIGSTKRIILSDTLKDKYTHDEIEVILAHEFSHYRLRHLLKLILVNSLATVIIFYLIFKTSNYFLGIFGLSSLSDISSLPLILIYFVIFGIIMQPFENYISRRLERNADRLALKITGLKEAFISMMDKLAAQNLADRNPHPVIKFFFFDHPSIDERINMAKGQVPDYFGTRC